MPSVKLSRELEVKYASRFGREERDLLPQLSDNMSWYARKVGLEIASPEIPYHPYHSGVKERAAHLTRRSVGSHQATSNRSGKQQVRVSLARDDRNLDLVRERSTA